MTEVPQRAKLCRSIAYVGLVIFIAIALVRLGGQLQQRVAFPWDLLTCFESPHLAALAKLEHGEPLYGPASDANSEPYPPLTAWTTYAILKPLGRALDIRAARAVAVGITLLTTLVASMIVRRTWIAAEMPSSTQFALMPLVLAAALLLLHKCMTSDQPHPDNLHILHAAVLLLLSLRAMSTDRTTAWLAAISWASIGILTKQTAALAPVAVIAMLLSDRSLDVRRRWTLIGMCVLSGAFVAGLLLSDPQRDFHLRTALGSHAVDWSRLELLVTSEVPIRYFPRAMVLVIALPGALRFHCEPALRPYLIAWSAIGFFEVLPAIAGFLKTGGNYNNLGVIDFWLFLITAPYLSMFAASTVGTVEFGLIDRKQLLRSVGSTFLCCWFVGASWPTKLMPNEHCYRLGRQVEQLVRDDVAAGRRIWLTAGLTFRFQAGDTTTPRDLGIALWTLEAAGSGRAEAALFVGIDHRLASGEYDRVYDFFPWDLKTRSILDKHYKKTDSIRGAGYSMHEEHRGIQPFVNRCTIYELAR